jgi:hypothetical protein
MQSLAEALLNLVVGYVVGFAAQIIVFHWYNIPVSLSQNFQMSIIFMVISLVRSYLLRRLFNKLHAAQVHK